MRGGDKKRKWSETRKGREDGDGRRRKGRDKGKKRSKIFPTPPIQWAALDWPSPEGKLICQRDLSLLLVGWCPGSSAELCWEHPSLISEAPASSNGPWASWAAEGPESLHVVWADARLCSQRGYYPGLTRGLMPGQGLETSESSGRQTVVPLGWWKHGESSSLSWVWLGWQAAPMSIVNGQREATHGNRVIWVSPVGTFGQLTETESCPNLTCPQIAHSLVRKRWQSTKLLRLKYVL